MYVSRVFAKQHSSTAARGSCCSIRQPKLRNHRRRSVRTRAAEDVLARVAAEHNYVSFDSAVDIMTYHADNVEILLKQVISSTEFVGQEIAWIFMYCVIMNILGLMRGS